MMKARACKSVPHFGRAKPLSVSGSTIGNDGTDGAGVPKVFLRTTGLSLRVPCRRLWKWMGANYIDGISSYAPWQAGWLKDMGGDLEKHV